MNRLEARGSVVVMPVWLRLLNPIRLRDEGSFHADGIAPQLERKGLLAKGEGARIRREIDRDWRLRKIYDPQLREVIRAAGHDGVIYKNAHEAPGDSFIAFDPRQIKSAIGNSGLYLADSPSLSDVVDQVSLDVVARARRARHAIPSQPSPLPASIISMAI